MTNEQKSVRDWMKAFGQETLDKPCIPSLEIRKLRAKLHLEECLESITALGFSNLRGLQVGDTFIISGGRYNSLDLSELLKQLNNNQVIFENHNELKPNLKEIADGCSDLSVVNFGTLVACGLIKQQHKDSISEYKENDPLFDEVMRSNWTKLWSTTEVNQKVVTDGDSPAFDATAIIATNTLCDDEGNTYKAVGNDKWLVKNRDGKVVKSPSYSRAELQPIIDQL